MLKRQFLLITNSLLFDNINNNIFLIKINDFEITDNVNNATNSATNHHSSLDEDVFRSNPRYECTN